MKMLNYKECTIEEFQAAMAEKNKCVKEISDEYLYILYTKFKADARQCFHAGSSYARGLGITSEKMAEMYWTELLERGYTDELCLVRRPKQ